MSKISIFGHQNPDTDSITSAISLSYLKNKLGLDTEARVLGHVNKETSYALNYFGVKEPKYLNDVKVQIKNIEYLAKKTAREVAKTKVEAKLDSMNSYERRIVHSILSEDKYVYTESIGEEPNRCVVIKPKEM